MLTGEVQQVRDDPSCCRTLVIDTADWAEKLCTAALLARGYTQQRVAIMVGAAPVTVSGWAKQAREEGGSREV